MQIIESVDHSLSLVLLPERRSLQSELELAGDTLGNAIHYLVSEQGVGRRVMDEARREAIEILCRAGREILQRERRRAARKAIALWMTSAA